MNNRIVLDIDGVLADFEGSFCESFGKDKRHLVKLDARYPNKSKEIIEFVQDPNTYTDLRVLPLGRQIALWINKRGYRIEMVSSRPHSAFKITLHWLTSNGIPFDSIYVDDSEPKVGEIEQINPIFAIDDLGEVAEKLAKVGIPTILISQPWNQLFIRKYPRISKFRQFLYRFQQISGDAYDTQESIGSGRSLQQPRSKLASS